MVSNPMQRKSRNSFILGLLLGLFFMGAIAAFLLYQLKLMKDEENARIAKEKIVYTLISDVKSGTELTADLFTTTSVTADAIPSDAMTIASLTEQTIAKIDLKQGTILSQGIVQESDQKETDDVRVQEYNMLKLSSQVQTGDYIDVRLRMPSGMDYIVVSKKKVEVPEIDGIPSENTIWIKMTEEETLMMSEAIVESYMMEGAVLYTTNYVDPGLQAVATPTYIPSESVINMITRNPNVVSEAAQAVYNRYTQDARNKISSEVNKDAERAEENVKAKTSSEISNAQTQRKNYLDTLAGDY